jgi:hypothetical protein
MCGACLGHEAGDSKGQQRFQAASRDLASTSVNAQEQQLVFGHAVYAMQEVRDWKHLWRRAADGQQPTAVGSSTTAGRSVTDRRITRALAPALTCGFLTIIHDP